MPNDAAAARRIADLERELAAARTQVDVAARVQRARELHDQQDNYRALMRAAGEERNMVIYELYKLTDYSYSELGGLLGISAARVGQIVQAARVQEMAADGNPDV